MPIHLTEHFTLEEMIFSQTAIRRGFDNTPNLAVRNNLIVLCEEILEPARKALGALRVSSGYRSIDVNEAIGGALDSAHTMGYAADIIPLEVPKLEFARWVAKNCDFDQIILEFGKVNDPAWIHISYKPPRRKQILHGVGIPARYRKVNL